MNLVQRSILILLIEYLFIEKAECQFNEKGLFLIERFCLNK